MEVLYLGMHTTEAGHRYGHHASTGGPPVMFSRWGAFVYRFRRPIVVLTVLFALGAAAFAPRASSELSSGGWLDPHSESAAVQNRLASEFGGGKSDLIALFRAGPAAD